MSGHQTSPDDEFSKANAGVGGTGFDQIFSIRDYARNLWRFRLLFAIAIVIGAVWAVYTEAHAPKLYSVSIQVGPVGDAPVASTGIGGLASLFLSGGSLSQGPPEWSRYVYTITSVRLAQKLNREYNMLHTVFSTRWDEKTHSWKPTPGFGAAVSRFFRGLFGLPPDPVPDIASLQGYVSSNVFLATDKETGATSLSTVAGDPKAGLTLLLRVHYAAVELVRDEIATRNAAKIDYLDRTIKTTANDQQRQILISMLAQTEQTQMLLNNDLPFAAQIIDTPVVPALPGSPAPINVLLIYRIGMLVFLIAAMVAFDQISNTGIATYFDNVLRGLPRRAAQGCAHAWAKIVGAPAV